jgi:glycosyltransferase involved in cell wall biosynthesis
LFYGFADRCLLYSSKGLEHLVGIGADRRRMEVCFNGIEIEPLIAGERQIAADAERIRERNAAQDAFVFLYVGGLLEEKRVDLLLEAFDAVRKKMPQIRLWIVGDGPDATRLKALAAGQIEVSFLGRIIDGVDQYFAAADAFVLPGIGGLAFNQAMFWRTPCISSVADGTEDDLVIDGVTGFRFEEGSRASLAAAMARAARTAPEDRRRMGESARRVVVERSNVDYMVAQFAKTLASLHDGSPPQGAVPDAGSKARFESNNEPV